MKIALCDLNHVTRGVHTNTVSLGLGLISSFFCKNIDHDFDVRMFKEFDKASEFFKKWTPDVLGITQYVWNSELNIYAARFVKKINPDCLIIAGGPNLDLSAQLRTNFLEENDCVDICIAFDGEIPFTEVLKRLLNKESKDDIKNNPVQGSYAISPESGKLVESLSTIPRLKSLDVFGAIYANGIFENMLEDGFHPFVQTHRGCPFSCTFCHTSDEYYSKMIFLSPEIFEKDMGYLGKLFSNKPNVVLYIANTNMSLFKEDFLIAEIIRKTQNKYGWPKLINVNSGKNPDKLIDMLSIINFQPGIALQTLTPKVLKNIKRKNITFDSFLSFQNKVSKIIEKPSATELILCLPGETKKSFLDTLRKVLNSEIENIIIYTLMKLKGTPLASEESSIKHKYSTRYRIVPRQFSHLNERLILDTEEVIVSTDTMSFDDYIELRGVSFSVTVFFSAIELSPLKKYLLEKNLDIAQWIFNIHSTILKDQSELAIVYNSFLRETERELFFSKKELNDFYSIPENYNLLRSGEVGDNLLRKYKYNILSKYFRQLVELAISEAAIITNDSSNAEELNDLKTFILTRDLKQYFDKSKYESLYFRLNYDIPEWLNSKKEELCIKDFKLPCDYRIMFPERAKEVLNNILGLNRDYDLSLQILYRDGITMKLWPTWNKIEKQE